MKRLSALIIVLSIMLLTVSCGGAARRHTAPPNPLNSTYRIAILPLYNDTMSVKGPVMVRKVLFKKLKGYHYSVKDLNETDKILRDRLGVTLGKQIALVDRELLKNELGVDALLYGYLLNFDSVTLGAYNVRKVRAAFKLVDAESGEVLWSRAQGVKTTLSAKGVGSLFKDRDKGEDISTRIPGLEEIPGIGKWKTMNDFKDVPAEAAVLIGFTELLVTKVLRVNLLSQTKKMVSIITRDFPRELGDKIAYSKVADDLEEIAYKKTKSSLLYPVPYLGLRDKEDFTASITMIVIDKDSGREDRFEVIIAKRGGNIRSSYLDAAGEEKAAVIITDDGKEIFLYPEKKKFIVMETQDSNHEEDISIDFEGFDNKGLSRYSVTVASEGSSPIRKGLIWERDGFPIRAEFEDDGSKTTITVEDVGFRRPLNALFEIPEDYTETDTYGLTSQE